MSGFVLFLSWCWCVNIALNALGFAKKHLSLLERIDSPLDLGHAAWDGRRVLGPSTTWGGLVLVVILGGIAAGAGGAYLFGLALLVYAGHLLGSFIKRRLGVRDGGFVPFLDHGNYVLTAGSLAVAAGELGALGLAGAYVATILVTPLVTFGAHRMKIRAAPL